MPLCECGCGDEVKFGNRFINGHNRQNCIASDESKKRMSEARKGEKKSEDHKKKISESLKGNKNALGNKSKLGQIISDETKKKISESLEGNKNFLGHKHTEETKKKISDGIIKHHYIYDFNDWDKYTIPVSRSEHNTIHWNLRKAGLEVPCINIMKKAETHVGDA